MLYLKTFAYDKKICGKNINYKCGQYITNIESIFSHCDSLCAEFKDEKLNFVVIYINSYSSSGTRLFDFDHNKFESYASLLESDIFKGWDENTSTFFISHQLRKELIDYGAKLIDRAKLIDMLDLV